jgi:hypothetical protein
MADPLEGGLEPLKRIRCAHCGIVKPAYQFNTSQQTEAAYGRPAICQMCVRAQKKEKDKTHAF